MNKQESPPFQNPDTRDFWTAALQGRVVFQHCRSCRAVFAYPRPYCVKCFSDDVSLEESGNRGQIYARTVVHLPMKADAEVGYTVVLVQLDNGLRMLARHSGPNAEIGAPVLLSWDLTGATPRLLARGAD